jgi:glycosyltransferase involved in cell wall biosynthesis
LTKAFNNQTTSIVVPVFNGERYISEAIHSILSASSSILEIIVVDDDSNDSTQPIVRNLRSRIPELRYARQNENSGPGPARNRGISMAKGAFVGFLDADDLYVTGALDTLLAPLLDNDAHDLSMGRIRAFRAADGSYGSDSFAPVGEALRCYQLSTVLVRRTAFQRFGVFDPQYLHCEDIDWFFRIQEQGAQILSINEVISLHREHSNNLSGDTVNGMADFTKVMRASLVRRRKLSKLVNKAPNDFYYVRPDILKVEQPH